MNGYAGVIAFSKCGNPYDDNSIKGYLGILYDSEAKVE